MNVDNFESHTDSSCQYPYSQNAPEATLTLRSLILNEIRCSGPIPFDRFMGIALYHPQLGYYTKGAQNVGKEGDFFTSVSTGSCFGMIMAYRISSSWLKLDTPDSFHLIEMGANAGHLALDILNSLREISPHLYQILTYHIIEPLPTIRQTQTKTLFPHSNKIKWHDSPQDLASSRLTGIILSNELIDALPVRLVKKEADHWRELRVKAENDQLTLDPSPISNPQLQKFTESLPADLPENYTTEYRPNIPILTGQWAEILGRGMVITIDYGHSRSNYYGPHRTTGTLRTFHQHRAGQNPLENIGSQDITAHVDFTQLAQAFIDSGFTITSFSPQSNYLTKHATPWLTSLPSPPDPRQAKLIRQFHTLTHPTMLGKQFHVLEAQLPPSEINKDLHHLLEIEL